MASNDKVIIAGIAIVVVLAIIAIIGAACCACVLCFTTSTWHWGEWGGYTQTVHETRTSTYAATDNVELYVDTIGGSVEVVPSATATNITVSFDVYAPSGRLADVVTSTRSDRIDGNTIRITAEAKYRESIIASNRGADVTVTVPENASYSFNLHTLGGDITVPQLHGDSVYMDTLGGRLRLNGGKYTTVYMNTAGGDVTASYEATNATLKTLGGNIRVDTTQKAGTLYAHTMGGNIDIDTMQTEGSISADTLGGYVGLKLPADTLFSIDASTLGGNVDHHSIRMNATTDRSSALIGPTAGGAGNLTVKLKTMGGNVDISY